MSISRKLAIFRKFRANESGATMIEYALIATFVSVSIIVGLTQIGTKLSTQYINTVGAQLK